MQDVAHSFIEILGDSSHQSLSPIVSCKNSTDVASVEYHVVFVKAGIGTLSTIVVADSSVTKRSTSPMLSTHPSKKKMSQLLF